MTRPHHRRSGHPGPRDDPRASGLGRLRRRHPAAPGRSSGTTMLSSTDTDRIGIRAYPVDTVPGAADEHPAGTGCSTWSTWLAVLGRAGACSTRGCTRSRGRLWRSPRSGAGRWSAGGLFNLVEGIVDHQRARHPPRPARGRRTRRPGTSASSPLGGGRCVAGAAVAGRGGGAGVVDVCDRRTAVLTAHAGQRRAVPVPARSPRRTAGGCVWALPGRGGCASATRAGRAGADRQTASFGARRARCSLAAAGLARATTCAGHMWQHLLRRHAGAARPLVLGAPGHPRAAHGATGAPARAALRVLRHPAAQAAARSGHRPACSPPAGSTLLYLTPLVPGQPGRARACTGWSDLHFVLAGYLFSLVDRRPGPGSAPAPRCPVRLLVLRRRRGRPRHARAAPVRRPGRRRPGDRRRSYAPRPPSMYYGGRPAPRSCSPWPLAMRQRPTARPTVGSPARRRAGRLRRLSRAAISAAISSGVRPSVTTVAVATSA